jgi:hypothetical protein
LVRFLPQAPFLKYPLSLLLGTFDAVKVYTEQNETYLKPLNDNRQIVMNIYCCECNCEVDARLTSGAEVYPHRSDLSSLPFWICKQCNNFVGCHYKTKNRTRPLGVISNKEVKNAKVHIHKLIDPLWKNGLMKRGELYSKLSDKLGYMYHTGEIRSIEQARAIYVVCKAIHENANKIHAAPYEGGVKTH